MFSRRISGFAVMNAVIHTSVDMAAPDMPTGQATRDPALPSGLGRAQAYGPGTMNDAAGGSGARPDQAPEQLVPVEKRRLTTRFPSQTLRWMDSDSLKLRCRVWPRVSREPRSKGLGSAAAPKSGGANSGM